MKNDILSETGKTCFAVVFFIAVLSVVFVSMLEAQVVQDSTKADVETFPDSNSKFIAEASFSFGFGVKNMTVGQTTDNKDVNMSAGGGVGGSLDLYYRISPFAELGLTGGYQSSSLSVDLKNAKGSFNRGFLLTTIKYGIPVSATGVLKFGGGIGYYIPGDLDLDMGSVSGGGHNVYSYDGSIGFHLTGEYEIINSPNFSWGFGMNYYNVSYNLNLVKSNGVTIPINLLPAQVKNDVMKLDGGGIDFSVFIAFYL